MELFTYRVTHFGQTRFNVKFSVLTLIFTALLLAPLTVLHAAEDGLPPTLAPLLKRTCFECHDDKTAEGGLDLVGLPFELHDHATRGRWIRIHDRIEKGEEAWRADFTRPIAGGPLSVGFDRFFGIAASLDMVPYTFIEDDHVAVVPTLTNDFPMIIARTNGATRRGPAAAGFEAEAVLPVLIRSRAAIWRSVSARTGWC